MIWKSVSFWTACVFLTATAPAQIRTVSVEVFGAYTTTSRLYPNQSATDELSRDFFVSLDDIFHGGIEIRTLVTPFDLQLGLGTEYLQKTESITVPVGSSNLPVTDGYRAIPLELTGYFLPPIGNSHVQMFLGGGIGIYTGERIYEYAGATAQTVERGGGFGIHITGGAEYYFGARWSVRTQLKFRDIEFSSTNEFNKTTTKFEGAIVNLPKGQFSSRFSIDGLNARMGVAYNF